MEPMMGIQKQSLPVLAAECINALGIDLLLQFIKPGSNTLLSPYSIQCSLLLAYAGAEGTTRSEMAKILHYPCEGERIHQSFADLADLLDEIGRKSTEANERRTKLREEWHTNSKRRTVDYKVFIENQLYMDTEPTALFVANRVFIQTGVGLRQPFVDLLNAYHRAAFESLDFSKDPNGAVSHINRWVGEETLNRISNILPDNSLNHLTRIVLANSIYLKAVWSKPFWDGFTEPLPFYLEAGETAMVPTMTDSIDIGFQRFDDFIALTIPYDIGDLQFTILMPDKSDGIGQLGKRLDGKLLRECSALPRLEVRLHLPKFTLEPPTMPLRRDLQALGMQTAFDLPHGSANFEGIAPRRGKDYLLLSEIFHKTFLSLDEQGTEAAAVTIELGSGAAFDFGSQEEPKEIFVDRPFVFAIQHRDSGACLFLGYLSDPR
jgi:serpin B